MFDQQPGRPREHRGHRLVGPRPTRHALGNQGERHFVISTTTIVTTAIMIAISIAAAAAQMAAQQAQAAAQAKYQSAMAAQRQKEIDQNYALSVESYKEQTKGLQERQRQIDENATLDLQQNQIQSAQAQATARVAAGEAGVSGVNVDELLNDFKSQEARYRESVSSNLENQRNQTNQEIKGAQAQAEGRAQSIPNFIPQPIDQPNYLGAALRVGGSAVGAYQSVYGGVPTTPTTQSARIPTSDRLRGPY